MGKVTLGIPKDAVLELKKISNYDIFIETGTYRGLSSIWASEIFKNVITIENSKDIYKEYSPILKKINNVNPLFGNSKIILRKLTKKMNSSIIFWLDAHWSSGITYGKNDECPLIEEIKIIKSATKNSIIIIDDARFFCSPPPLPHNTDEWPTISEVIMALNSPDNSYIVIYDDVIYSVPILFKNDFISWLRTKEEAKQEKSFIKKISNNLRKISK